jgi:hypothetical protein
MRRFLCFHNPQINVWKITVLPHVNPNINIQYFELPHIKFGNGGVRESMFCRTHKKLKNLCNDAVGGHDRTRLFCTKYHNLYDLL